MRLLRLACAVALSFAWWFVTVDNTGKRHEFGPYKTRNECIGKRNLEAMTDGWVAVTACEEQ